MAPGDLKLPACLEFHKVDYLAVAYVDEGVSLRKAGIRLPIVVMNTEENALSPLIEWQLGAGYFLLSGFNSHAEIIEAGSHSAFSLFILSWKPV